MLDIGIISDKWLSIQGSEVYTPPPNFPTLHLAREHATPSPTWRKCDNITVVFTHGICKMILGKLEIVWK